jgi:hypothetical protein
MPILHRCAQYSEEYDELKLGIPTSSNFSRILTPTGERSRQRNSYGYRLIAERLLHRKIASFTSPAMERGLINESEAADWYCFERNCDAEPIGFITDDAGTIGCSPDRLIGEDGLLEIKCPEPPAQIEYLITGRVHRTHRPQLQGQLLVSEREWVDILAFNRELPKQIVRVERDEHYIALLRAALREFNEWMTVEMEKIVTAGYVHIPEAKRALREMLNAALQHEPSGRPTSAALEIVP